MNLAADQLKVKGPKGELSLAVNPDVGVAVEDGIAKVAAKGNSRFAAAMAGTTRALVQNMVDRRIQRF